MYKTIAKKQFREDLYYRLNVISVNIPPLRERTEDIAPLIALFKEKYNTIHKRDVVFTESAFNILEKYEWPGNIRQLENLIERIVITSEDGIIRAKDLPAEIVNEINVVDNVDDGIAEEMTYKDLIETYEKEIFISAAKRYKTSIAVAKALEISQTTASRKLRRYVKDYCR